MKLLIFDMDGVLVDVSKSYNIAIKKTADFFLGRIMDIDEVDKFKKKPGLNNDWDCTEAILNQQGVFPIKKAIIKKFQEYYVGKDFNGLINNESLLLNKSNIEKLSKKYILAIFTGRPKKEALFILNKFEILKHFKMVIALEDVSSQKPNPEGLNNIMNELKIKPAETVYAGDSIDDSISAKSAGISFIGVIPPYGNKEDLINSFKESKLILKDINDLTKLRL